MAEKAQFKAADGTVIIEIREEAGRFAMTLLPELFDRLTEEQWRRIRKNICEQIGYPEADWDAQENEFWSAVLRK